LLAHNAIELAREYPPALARLTRIALMGVPIAVCQSNSERDSMAPRWRRHAGRTKCGRRMHDVGLQHILTSYLWPVRRRPSLRRQLNDERSAPMSREPQPWAPVTTQQAACAKSCTLIWFRFSTGPSGNNTSYKQTPSPTSRCPGVSGHAQAGASMTAQPTISPRGNVKRSGQGRTPSYATRLPTKHRSMCRFPVEQLAEHGLSMCSAPI